MTELGLTNDDDPEPFADQVPDESEEYEPPRLLQPHELPKGVL